MVKAAGVDVEPIWFSLYAKALAGQDLKELVFNNVGAPSAGAAVAAAGTTAAAGAAAEEAKEEEKKKEEEKEESDEDMGFGKWPLFFSIPCFKT